MPKDTTSKPATPAAGAPPFSFPYPPPPFVYPPANSTNGDAPGPGGVPPPGFFPFPPLMQSAAASSSKPKRIQVKLACTNCAQACKRCDEERPCTRCRKYNLQDSCVDGQRKERKKGIKRGPYKRKAAKIELESPEASPVSAVAPPTAPAPAGAMPFPLPLPEGYPPPFYPVMGVAFYPPPPGSAEGAPPIPYYFPLPPYMFAQPSGSTPAPTTEASREKTEEDESQSATPDSKANSMPPDEQDEQEGSDADADGENDDDQLADDVDAVGDADV